MKNNKVLIDNRLTDRVKNLFRSYGVLLFITSFTFFVLNTFQSKAGTITLSSNTVSASTVCVPSVSSSKTAIQSFKLAVTGAGGGNLTDVSFHTTGSYATGDIVSYQLWYYTSNLLSGATQVGSTLINTGGAGTYTFASFTSPQLTNGNTYYFWITINISTSATIGNTIACNGISTTNLTSTSTKGGQTTTAGGTQTIDVITASPTTSPATYSNVCSGTTVTLTANATGTSPLSYTWSANGSYQSFQQFTTTSDPATINPTYTGSTYGSNWIYIQVTDSKGCSDEQIPSLLYLMPNPQATATSSNTPCTTSPIYLTGGPSGTYTYLWAGPNSYTSSLQSPTINYPDESDNGIYYLTVTSIYSCVGTAQTNSVSLDSPPSITQQPTGTSQCPGTNATFSIVTVSTSAQSYQWYKDGSQLSVTSSQLTLTNIQSSDAGNYYCVVSNDCGSVTSNNALLTINTAPTITQQPVAVTSCQSSVASFNISATGTASLNYQWYENGTQLSVNSDQLTLNSCQLSDAGNYYCIISNSCGQATSTTVTLTVNTTPTITQQTVSSSQCIGTSAAYSVTASSVLTESYQWLMNGNAITGATSTTYQLSNTDYSNIGDYNCVVTNSCGSVTSNTYSITNCCFTVH